MPELIINLSKVKDNYEQLRKELPLAIIAYAVKANYDEKILKTLKELGSSAEVCSEEEYALARKIGFERIIVNGFVKPLECFVQNFEEINQKNLSFLGARMKLEKESKLGIPDEEILKHNWDCIAFHSSKAKINDWKNYLSRAKKLAEKTKAKYIDAGGGLSPERIKILREVKGLIIEPGKSLVENACSLKTKVLAVKEKNIIIDTGINFFNKLSMSKYEVIALGKNGTKKPYRVCGPIPTDLDNIGFHNLPEVKPGDELLINNCGAYNLSMASDWVNKKPIIKYT